MKRSTFTVSVCAALAPPRLVLLGAFILAATISRSATVQSTTLIGDGIHDDTAALEAMLAGGHVVDIPPGTFLITHTLILRAGAQVHGAGTGITVIKLAPQANQDLMQSEQFEQLTGSARLAEAPADIRLSELTLDGGFLSAKWNDPHRQVQNVRGSCLALYAKRVYLDIAINNCAQHLLYSEGQGPRHGEEVASRYQIQGLVAGEECVVFRGPGDSRFAYLSAGVCGAKRLQPALVRATSALYPAEFGFDGVVVDRQKPYEGTLEIGFAHVFGSTSGWGLRTRGNPRLSVEHLVSESNLGGVLIDKDAWGAINTLDVHSNGASLGQDQTGIAIREGLSLQSEHGFSIAQATIARTAGSAQGFAGARLAGIGSNVTLTLVNTINSATGRDFRGTDAIVTGSSNIIRLTDPRAMDEALVVSGHDNLVEVTTKGRICDVGLRNVITGKGALRAEPCDPRTVSQELEIQ